MARLKSAPPSLSRPPVRLNGVPEDSQYERDRGSAKDRGYDATWRRERRAFLVDHPLCLGCDASGHAVPATVVDHIVPHRGDQRLFRDPRNRQPACKWHHDKVKQLLETMWQSGEITSDDLNLDSEAAVNLTRKLRDEEGRGGSNRHNRPAA